MLYKFNQHKKNEVEVSLDGVVVPKCKQYRCIGLLFEENGIVDEDVPPRIKYAWLKWRVLPGCCDKRMPIKVKDRFYRTNYKTNNFI